jgi:hypothetical protein
VALEADLSERTVYRWTKKASSVCENSQLRINKAIKKLRVKVK